MAKIHCGGMQDCRFLSSKGDGAVTSSFEDFLVICTFVFANHGLIFVLVKEITTMMVLRHLLYAHLTNFEFVGVAWA